MGSALFTGRESHTHLHPPHAMRCQDYLTVIKDPIDLSKIKQRLDDKYYKSKDMVKFY